MTRDDGTLTATLKALPAVYGAARVEALHGDASSRRYWRLWPATGPPVILACYPPGLDNTLERDLAVQQWLDRHQVRVPAVLASDPAAGWLLVEDLGSADAEQTLRAAAPTVRETLLPRLLAPLRALATVPAASLPAWNQPLAAPRLRWELAGYELWYQRFLLDRPPAAAVGRWLDHLAAEIGGHPQRVCHRDFHLNNLYLLADGSTAVIDAQDLLVGPDTYDVSSLLWERAAPELLGAAARQTWLEAWAGETGAAPGWQSRCRLTRVQRGLKVLGTFARLHLAGRPGYHRWLAPLARDLAGALAGLDPPVALLDQLRPCGPMLAPAQEKISSRIR